MTIADLNDALRKGTGAGRIMLTPGVLATVKPEEAILAVRNFDEKEFDEDSDPYGEHDFGAFDLANETMYWKIDYYNNDCSAGSENPADPKITTRVMTVMLASEY